SAGPSAPLATTSENGRSSGLPGPLTWGVPVEGDGISESEVLRSTGEAGRDHNDLVIFNDARAALSAPEVASSGFDRQTGSQETGSTPGTASLDLPRWLSLVALAYAAATAILVGRWLIGHLVLWRLLRTAQPAPENINQVFLMMARGQGFRPR